MKKVAIFGHGVVGSGVSRILLDRGKSLGLELSAICTKNPDPHFSRKDLFCDAKSIFENPEIKILFEAIGGVGAAFDFVKTALKSGKSVVTANKEMVAKHFVELHEIAEKSGGKILFEAAVGGGIPVLSAMRAGLSGDELLEIVGILNGTTNFILTEIEKTGADFADILKIAQQKGFAEADPTADIEGFDALYKLIILIALGFGKMFSPTEIPRRGISKILPIDFEYAEKFGGKIKLAAVAKKAGDEIFAEISPVLFFKNSRMARTDGVLNAILLRGAENTAGNFFSGEGAGSAPTAAAMISDAVSLAAADPIFPKKPTRGVFQKSPKQRFYVRFEVFDRPGIVGKIGEILGKKGISIDAIFQIPRQKSSPTHFAMTTFSAPRDDFLAAISETSKENFNAEMPFYFPIF